MYVRSARRPFGRMMSRGRVRALTMAVYLFYPAGCLLQLYPQTDEYGAAYHVGGLLLVAAALLAFAALAGTSFQRQAQEPESSLDERERAERNRAAYTAHSLFAGMVMLGVIYIMIATDMTQNGKAALWTPESGEHWNAIFWGLTIFAMTLPAAVLAWSKAPPDIE